ncbi:MAG TPA: type VI secretion system ATPase TssH, partial [Desulfobulbaceae bacterium]|nr:type VI secretion system ATPase TssH [Desulfobulbaceae bacterium]
SEFMEKHSVARLIGAPPGYVGYDEGGYLTEAVRRRPYAVILLDEIEKAHPDVFNVLLQVLDDGRMTDGKGRTVDFKNTILIMTSNLGSQLIMRMTEENADEKAIRAEVEALLRGHFKPEFLNRIDETILFHGLSKENMLAIVAIQLERLCERLRENGVTLEIGESAKEFLLENGYDPSFGARPLKRAIQQYLENPLALEMLEGKFAVGDSIRVDAGENGLLFFPLAKTQAD